MKKGETIICKYCGKEKYLFPYYLKKTGKTGFCSNRCRALYNGSKIVKCDYCAKKVLRIKGRLKKYKKQYCSIGCKGLDQKDKRPWNFGIKGICKPNSGSFKKGTPPEQHPSWKGGITKKDKRARGVIEYFDWRDAVFERDDWTCQKCEERGCYLHAHHIISFAKNKRKRYLISNGITLCKTCHMKHHGLLKN